MRTKVLQATSNSSRNHGIDLFRIVSMLMVVTLHVLGQGGILEASNSMLWKYQIAWLIEGACFGAVNCYALISGYVGINTKHKYSNILILWLQVVFLSSILSCIQACIPSSSTGVGSILTSFIPVFTRKYWYFTDYTLLFFFMPLLNAAIHALKKNVLRNSLIIISTLFCASSFFPGPYFMFDPFHLSEGYSMLWLMLLYLIGGYCAKYNPFSSVSTLQLIFIYLGCVTIATGSKLLLIYMPPFIQEFLPNDALIYYNSPLILVSAISLLMFFKRFHTLPFFVAAIVKFVSPLCFGIYIIHLHPLVWDWLDQRFSNFVTHSVPIMLCATTCAVIFLFMICMILEIIRYYIFKLFKIKEHLLALEDKWLCFGHKQNN